MLLEQQSRLRRKLGINMDYFGLTEEELQKEADSIRAEVDADPDCRDVKLSEERAEELYDNIVKRLKDAGLRAL